MSRRPRPLATHVDVTSLAVRVIDQLRGGGHLLLLTDYDGTLTPIVPTPDEAWLPRAVHDDLDVLARSPRTHVSVVSGRDLADLRERVAVPAAIYGGCHGLEIEGPGMRFCHPGALARQETVSAVARALSLRANAVTGMRVEQKRLGVAVHYRQVSPDQEQHVEAEVARVLQQEGRGLTSFHDTKVIEIQPSVSWTKGDCALWVLDRVRSASGRRIEVLCIGDDWTDEDMFDAVAGQAITVGVADHVPESRAAYRLPDVASVQRLLALLAAWARSSR
jgi:trehalose-phosphatase